MSNAVETRADQVALLTHLLRSSEEVSSKWIAYSAWAAALTTGSEYVRSLVAEEIDVLSELDRRDVEFAIARMGVTNPYFVARQFVSVGAGGSLSALNFRNFSQLDIQNDMAYHHACVALSLVNGGYVCLQAHVTQLQAAGISDKDIDVTMRIAAACHSLKILGSLPE